MYGVTIWGCARREEMKTAQERCVKMALGVNSNTPGYLWRIVVGAGNYFCMIVKMEDDKWPRICLREEIGSLEINCIHFGRSNERGGKGITCERITN